MLLCVLFIGHFDLLTFVKVSQVLFFFFCSKKFYKENNYFDPTSVLIIVHYLSLYDNDASGFACDSVDSTLFDPVIFINEYLGDEGKLEGMLSRKSIKIMADVSYL